MLHVRIPTREDVFHDGVQCISQAHLAQVQVLALVNAAVELTDHLGDLRTNTNFVSNSVNAWLIFLAK